MLCRYLPRAPQCNIPYLKLVLVSELFDGVHHLQGVLVVAVRKLFDYD